jgi:hypothetical protein
MTTSDAHAALSPENTLPRAPALLCAPVSSHAPISEHLPTTTPAVFAFSSSTISIAPPSTITTRAAHPSTRARSATPRAFPDASPSSSALASVADVNPPKSVNRYASARVVGARARINAESSALFRASSMIPEDDDDEEDPAVTHRPTNPSSYVTSSFGDTAADAAARVEHGSRRRPRRVLRWTTFGVGVGIVVVAQTPRIDSHDFGIRIGFAV